MIIIISISTLQSPALTVHKENNSMKRSIYTIAENNGQFILQLFDEKENLILTSKSFESFALCQKFLATLRLHLCFQTNFSRSKNISGQFGYEIRTCWDELIGSSTWFASRQEREESMHTAFRLNKDAVFVHTSMYQQTPSLNLRVVA